MQTVVLREIREGEEEIKHEQMVKKKRKIDMRGGGGKALIVVV